MRLWVLWNNINAMSFVVRWRGDNLAEVQSMFGAAALTREPDGTLTVEQDIEWPIVPHTYVRTTFTAQPGDWIGTAPERDELVNWTSQPGNYGVLVD